MGAQINYGNLEQQFRVAFPELEGTYQEQLGAFGDEKQLGNYLVFGVVLVPRLEAELDRGERTSFMQRVAAFMDRVCASGDLEAINLLWLEVFKRLLDEPEKLKLLWPVLGDCTKEEIEHAAKRWRKTGSLPVSGSWKRFLGQPGS